MRQAIASRHLVNLVTLLPSEQECQECQECYSATIFYEIRLTLNMYVYTVVYACFNMRGCNLDILDILAQI